MLRSRFLRSFAELRRVSPIRCSTCAAAGRASRPSMMAFQRGLRPGPACRVEASSAPAAAFAARGRCQSLRRPMMRRAVRGFVSTFRSRASARPSARRRSVDLDTTPEIVEQGSRHRRCCRAGRPGRDRSCCCLQEWTKIPIRRLANAAGRAGRSPQRASSAALVVGLGRRSCSRPLCHSSSRSSALAVLGGFGRLDGPGQVERVGGVGQLVQLGGAQSPAFRDIAQPAVEIGVDSLLSPLRIVELGQARGSFTPQPATLVGEQGHQRFDAFVRGIVDNKAPSDSARLAVVDA